MCKLCKNNEKSHEFKEYSIGAKRKEYSNVVFQYTGMYACSSVLKKIDTALWGYKENNLERNIDNYIIDKLLKEYTEDGVKIGKLNQKIYLTLNVKKKMIEHNIRLVHNKITNTTSYTVIIVINKKQKNRNFNTLKEARRYRQQMLQFRTKIGRPNKQKENICQKEKIQSQQS